METKQIIPIEDRELFYSKTYPIKYYEMDFNRVLKPSALLNCLQDLATENAEVLGFGPTFIFKNNYAWFLIKYRMEFDEYPSNVEELVLKTEARGISKIIANRDFEIYTKEDKRLARVASSWMLIDIESKSVLPLSKTIDYMPTFEKRENDLQYNKIKPLEKVDFEKTFSIRFDDIDVNQHVNNSNYIIWAFEALPYNFNATHKIKTLDIVYKKEIAYGHDVLSQAGVNGNKTTHVLKNAKTGEDLCFINVEWTK